MKLKLIQTMKLRWSISKEAGFTLIEMITVLAIVVIMASIIALNYSADRLKLALLRSAQKLSLDLHRVETYSLTSKEFQASGVPYSWGMHFYGADSTNYTIFADLDNDRTFDSGIENLETLDLESGVKVSSAVTDAVFIPPDPDVVFNNDPALTSVSITLTNGSMARTITINKFGAITVSSP